MCPKASRGSWHSRRHHAPGAPRHLSNWRLRHLNQAGPLGSLGHGLIPPGPRPLAGRAGSAFHFGLPPCCAVAISDVPRPQAGRVMPPGALQGRAAGASCPGPDGWGFPRARSRPFRDVSGPARIWRRAGRTGMPRRRPHPCGPGPPCRPGTGPGSAAGACAGTAPRGGPKIA